MKKVNLLAVCKSFYFLLQDFIFSFNFALVKTISNLSFEIPYTHFKQNNLTNKCHLDEFLIEVKNFSILDCNPTSLLPTIAWLVIQYKGLLYLS
jgi:hypothetical protein